MDAERIAHLRGLEASVIQDVKKSNNLVEMKKIFLSADTSPKVKQAAMHSLRRVFRNLFENGNFKKPTKSENSPQLEKLEQYRLWLHQQYFIVKKEIMSDSMSSSLEMQVPAIRTIMEFVSLEHKNLEPSPHTGVNTFNALIRNIMQGNDLDIDVLLMLREEVFSKQDCAYYSLKTISKTLAELKATQASNCEKVVQNVLDILRLINIAYPNDDGEPTETIDVTTFLLSPESVENFDESSDDENYVEDSDDSDNEKPHDISKSGGKMHKKRLLKRSESRKKKVAKMTAAEKILEKSCHVKEFSKAWLILLSFPMSKKQQRLSLKHISTHVTSYLHQPMLLADYLIKTVDKGGIVGILALDSLFHLIVQHNLDYPDFFEALYRLCNVDTFASKHRSKFAKLLSLSLKSNNIPAYSIGAFIKRLSNLSIKIPGPGALFCLSQVVILLREHPQCHKLIHNDDCDKDKYDSTSNTKNCEALSTSLFEVDLLQNHYVPKVALMAKSLEENAELSGGNKKNNLCFDIETASSSTYQSLIEESLKGSKSNAPLAYQTPSCLFSQHSIVRQCFGNSS